MSVVFFQNLLTAIKTEFNRYRLQLSNKKIYIFQACLSCPGDNYGKNQKDWSFIVSKNIWNIVCLYGINPRCDIYIGLACFFCIFFHRVKYVWGIVWCRGNNILTNFLWSAWFCVRINYGTIIQSCFFFGWRA